jgi:predicted acyltransferase
MATEPLKPEEGGAVARVSDDPIVVESAVHGEEVAEWRPSAPTRAPAAIWRPIDEDVPVPGTGQSPAPPELAAPDSSRRAFSLDALRGFFLLTMTMGFTIGTAKYYPEWMFHRQEPWGAPEPVDVAGISWRDLAYASFLFTMAAALPLTMSRRIQKGELEVGIVMAAVRRWGMLLIYAILIGHSNTYFTGYTQTGRVLALVGFAVMAMVFTRRRADWDERKFTLVNRAGWILAIAFLVLSPLAYGKTFSFDRNDDVIVGLAFASFVGIVAWYFTRENLTARLGILAAAVALYLGAKGGGWVAGWWWDSPLPWLFSPQRLVLLAVVIPGTIMGDVILRWMREPADAIDGGRTWTGLRLGGLTVLSIAFTPLVTIGMYNRWVGLTTLLCVALIIGGAFLTHAPGNATERMLRSLFVWASAWLMIGLFLEPFENGIRKVPDTLSYFFTITGTTSMLLLGLTALVDGLRRRQWVSVLVDLGHNPLMLYVMYTVLINSVLELIPPLRGVLRGSLGEAMVRSLLSVGLVVLIVRYMSRKRIYWRT